MVQTADLTSPTGEKASTYTCWACAHVSHVAHALIGRGHTASWDTATLHSSACVLVFGLHSRRIQGSFFWVSILGKGSREQAGTRGLKTPARFHSSKDCIVQCHSGLQQVAGPKRRNQYPIGGNLGSRGRLPPFFVLLSFFFIGEIYAVTALGAATTDAKSDDGM